MSIPQTAQSIPMNLPVQGIDMLNPLASMEPIYSPWMVNFEPEERVVKCRNGLISHAFIYGTGTTEVLGLIAHGDSKLFAYVKDTSGTHKIWDITSGGDFTNPPDVTLADDTAIRVYSFHYAGRSAFAGNSDYDDCNKVYDGSAWGAWPWTYGGSTISSPCVTAYKGRVYLFGNNYTECYYSDIDGVGGTTTKIDFEYLFNEKSFIRWAMPLSSPGLRADELMLAFGNVLGEILVYAGDYPGATNWQIVGKFKVSKLLFYQSYLSYKNDIWLMTADGVVSVRRLMAYGDNDSSSFTVSKQINPYWTKLVRTIVENTGDTFESRASMAYWPEKNKIYCMIRGFIDEDGSYNDDYATMFVYNGFTESWAIYKVTSLYSSKFGGLTYFQNNLYYYSLNAVMKFGSGYKDEKYDDPGVYNAIDLELHSAYTDFGNYNKHT